LRLASQLFKDEGRPVSNRPPLYFAVDEDRATLAVHDGVAGASRTALTAPAQCRNRVILAVGISAPSTVAIKMGDPTPESLRRAFEFFRRRRALQQLQNLGASCIWYTHAIVAQVLDRGIPILDHGTV
jgi:hypothetical protein